MANKVMKKVKIDKECLQDALELRECSIRKLGRDYNFGWSAKSIERGIKAGEVSPDLLDALGKYLDVDPEFLTGKHHRDAEKIEDEEIVKSLKRGLRAYRFPYIYKQQRTKENDMWLYDRYLESLLIIHDISNKQYDKKTFEEKKTIQLELEDAISKVLIRHFEKNAMGNELYPGIYKLYNDIEDYNGYEELPPDDIFDSEDTDDDPFYEKYHTPKE